MTSDQGDRNSTDRDGPDGESGREGADDVSMSDDELLARLRLERSTIDSAPDGLTDVAMRALTWDTDLARLVLPALDGGEPVPVRGGVGYETSDVVDLSFEIEGVVLEVSIEPVAAGNGYRLSGLVLPRCDRVQLVSPGAVPQSVDCDSFGRFGVTIGTEPVAIGFDLPDGRSVRTELLDLP